MWAGASGKLPLTCYPLQIGCYLAKNEEHKTLIACKAVQYFLKCTSCAMQPRCCL